MDNETVNSIWGMMVGVLVGGELFAIGSAIYSDRKAKKVAPILDAQYGPKIKGNLARLEDAVQKNDRHEALQALGERSVLLTELKQINSGYFRYNTRAIGSPYQGCASAEVKADIAKGDGLEKYLKA